VPGPQPDPALRHPAVRNPHQREEPVMGGLIETLLPLVRDVASKLEGSEFADAALADVREVEARAKRASDALDADLVQWWAEARHAAGAVIQAAEGAHAAPADSEPAA
jgi:hypothetical protein